MMRLLKHGNTISLQGQPYRISFEKTRFIKPQVVKESAELKVFLSELSNIKHKTILFNWLKNHANIIISKRVVELANIHGFEYNRVTIRDQRTRWGSCSARKNLNFNWKLILVDPQELDYVVVHELAHLRQMNHSMAFWLIVESIIPDYINIKKSLRAKEKEYI